MALTMNKGLIHSGRSAKRSTPAKFNIMRFTPAATRIMDLITSDKVRPVGHIVSNLKDYDRLLKDILEVLDTLISKELEVQILTGAWYTLHIMPYRTLDNVIEGAVITFVDITERKKIQENLEKANDQLRLAVVVRDAHDAVTVQDLDGRTIAWNPAAVRMYGWSEAEALMMNIRDRIPEGLREESLAKIHHLSLVKILEPRDRPGKMDLVAGKPGKPLAPRNPADSSRTLRASDRTGDAKRGTTSHAGGTGQCASALLRPVRPGAGRLIAH